MKTVSIIYIDHYISIGVCFLTVEIDGAIEKFTRMHTVDNNQTWSHFSKAITSEINEALSLIYLEGHKKYIEYNLAKRRLEPIKRGDYVIDKSGVVKGGFECPEIIDGHIEVLGFGKLHIDNLEKK